MSKVTQIDDLDRKILTLLTEDAKRPYTDLAKELFVSGGTIHVRMNKMEELGLVKGSKLEIDYRKLGYDIVAFIGIYMDKSSLYKNVLDELKNIPEIVNAFYTTGSYGLFVRILCRDTEHLRQVLTDKLQQIKGIQRTETFISLEENINRPPNLLSDSE